VILVDTSIWIDHLRVGDDRLVAALNGQEVGCHPVIVGELALGGIRDRRAFLTDLERLPRAIVARDEEVLSLVESRALHGRGLSYPDACLLASALLTAGVRLWTRDSRLRATAVELGIEVL
jgi:predicted nucleic acid-binding protein